MSSPFPRTAEFEDSTLVALGGVQVTELAAEFGTPLYVLDRAELVERMRGYRRAFGPDVAIAYAAKALCVVGVLQLVAAERLHVDVASSGELATALRAGVPPARVLLHGNNKSPAELAQAVALGVGRVVVDSFTELDSLAGADVDLLLRVTPGVETHTHAFIRTGHDDSKFGFTLSAGLAHEAIARALALPGARLRGLHCHIGSQILHTAPYEEAAVRMVGLIADARDRHAVVLDELNLGGGLAVGYEQGDDPPALEDYASTICGAVARECARHGLPLPHLTVEPGRSIAAPAGVTLYRVGVVKDVPGVRTYVAVDGGMSDNVRPALYGASYTFAPAAAAAVPGAARPVTVVGKHCESGDVLGREVMLPEGVAPEGLLAVAGTGAYAHAMASNYNRLPRPAMVLVGDGDARLLVRRETLDDVLGRDVLLDSPP